MKKLLFQLVFLAAFATASAQENKLYNPNTNAENDIAKAVEKAAIENKHVLVMGGGNWCIWCLRFNDFITKDAQLDSLVKAGYVMYHLNYSKENRNDATFARYAFPQRFGFPVFIILNGKGERIHTQNSGLLEEGKGYSKDKVKEFLSQWSPAALNQALYENGGR